MCIYRFFFNNTAATVIYTLSLHDALPISRRLVLRKDRRLAACEGCLSRRLRRGGLEVRSDGAAGEGERSQSASKKLDRKSTRLNSSHVEISYAVFCLKKKTNQ